MTSLVCHWPMAIVILEMVMEVNLSKFCGAMYLVPVLVFGVIDYRSLAAAEKKPGSPRVLGVILDGAHSCT